MEVDFTGDARLQNVLDAIHDAGIKLHPAMEIIARNWQNKVKLGFRGGVDPYGTPWRPLRFRSGQPLRDTGRLQQSVDTRSSDEQAATGTNVCYAIVHQEGTTVTAGKPPHMGLCGVMTKGANVLRFKASRGWMSAKKVEIPARQIFPSADRGLPKAWENAAANALIKHLQKGATHG